jgi:hypothetical protein
MSLGHAIEVLDVESYIIARGASPVKDNEYVMDCPTCGKRKLTVNTDVKAWHCWVCEQYRLQGNRRVAVSGAGNMIDLVVLLEGVTKQQAIDWILEATKHDRRPTMRRVMSMASKAVERQESKPRPNGVPYPHYSVPFTGDHPYLLQRGITFADVQTFGLFFCTAGEYANRVIFPVWENGGLAYYQARAAWDPAQIKTLNPPRDIGVTSAHVLMNLNQAAKHNRVAITEGPIDCVHAGIDSVCTFGKKITSHQVAKLYSAGVRAVDLMWDGPSESEPEGAWPEMEAAARKLSELFDVRLVRLPYGDPGDWPRHDLTRFRAHGEPAIKHTRLWAPMQGW